MKHLMKHFQDDGIYEEPARDVGGLYAQLEIRLITDTVRRDNIRSEL